MVVNGNTFTFTGLEPLIVHGLASFEVAMPDALSDLAIETLDLADLSLTNLVLHSVTVDGVISWRQQVKLAGVNSPEPKSYGQAIALSQDGDTLVVGADRTGETSGVVFVYSRSGTTWTEQAKLYPDDRLSGGGAGFGRSVAIDGNLLVVGSPNDINRGYDTGAIYIYRLVNGAWTQEWKQRGDSAGNKFGTSVGVDGTNSRIMVGAPGANRVYVYLYDGSQLIDKWPLSVTLSGSGEFGYSLDLDNSGVALIGAPSANGTGEAYIYNRNGDNTWTKKATLISTSEQSGERFGAAVALKQYSGRAVVGSPNYDGKNADQGAAWVFEGSAENWHLVARLTADGGLPDNEATHEGNAGDHFGASVAIYDNYVAVGAPDYDGNSANQGKAYVFYRLDQYCGGGCDPIAWTRSLNLSSSTPAENEYFGKALVLGDKLLVIGVPGFNETDANNNITREGIGDIRTYTTNGSMSINDLSDAETGLYRAETLTGGDNFGRQTIFDDSHNELIVSAYGENKVYVFVDEGLYWRQVQVLEQSSGKFGYDMDLDGTRLVVGAPGDNKLYIYEYGDNGYELAETISGPTGAEAFGAAVAVEGDLIAVGAPDTTMWYSSVNQPVADYKLQLGKTGVAFDYKLYNGAWTPDAYFFPYTQGIYFTDTTFEKDGFTYTIVNPNPNATSYKGEYTPDGPQAIVQDDLSESDQNYYTFTLNNYQINWVNSDLNDEDKSVEVWPMTCAMIWDSNDGDGRAYKVCNNSYDNASRVTVAGKDYVDAVLVFNGADKYVDSDGTEYTPGAAVSASNLPENRVIWFYGPDIHDLHNLKYGGLGDGKYYDLSDEDTGWTLQPYTCAAVMDDTRGSGNASVVYCNDTALQKTYPGINNVDYVGVFAYTDSLGVLGRTLTATGTYSYDGLNNAQFGASIELSGSKIYIGAPGINAQYTEDVTSHWI